MPLKAVLPGVYLVPMGSANGYLIEGEDGLTLIDAGWPNKEGAVLDAVRALGRRPGDLRHLVLTHAHPDHIGSAAAIVRATGATTYMHPADIPLAASGGPFRPVTPAPGLVRRVLLPLFFRPGDPMEPVAIDRPLADGETLPIAGGLDVIHAPGHCAGQVALLWRPGRMLFAADAFGNTMGLGDPLGFEDEAMGRASQRRLAALPFEAVGFGHGKPIARDAAGRLRAFVGGAGQRP